MGILKKNLTFPQQPRQEKDSLCLIHYHHRLEDLHPLKRKYLPFTNMRSLKTNQSQFHLLIHHQNQKQYQPSPQQLLLLGLQIFHTTVMTTAVVLVIYHHHQIIYCQYIVVIHHHPVLSHNEMPFLSHLLINTLLKYLREKRRQINK